MRFWDVSGPDVEAADAEPWDGRWAGAMRPFSTGALVRLTAAAGVLYLLEPGVGLGAVLLNPSLGEHRTVGFMLCAGGLAVGVAIFVALAVLSPRQIRRSAPVTALTLLMVTPLIASAGMASLGPQFAVWATVYIGAPMFAFYTVRLRWAVACASLVLAGFGLIVSLQEGWFAPKAQWSAVAAIVVATAVLMGLIAERADALAASEHDARVELATLNRTLEHRVSQQVGEIERLSELRRFLSPQVADAVLSGQAEEVTMPHRRRIAVFFCDLRGFTAFTNGAEPEEVIGVLDEYYRVVGGLLQRYDATVGDYAGDGIMAYFGDPVPREDSATAAVEMTREIAHVMGPVVAEWQRRDYQLDYGVGLAYGYATLGVVGFDGRYDYKPVGGVVNLAARLCARSEEGRVLLDHATHAETSDLFPSAHFADLDLKGYGGPTKVYSLT
ncbi:class 3 adenylate cyclase [Marmoricola sp. URHA0025 HA25]